MFFWKKFLIIACLTAFLASGMFFLFRFYGDKNETSDSLEHTNVYSAAPIHTDSGSEKVFSRNEMRAMIEGFGEPSGEDIKVFQKDERYHGYLKMLESLNGSIAQETKDALMQRAYLLWFQQERLLEKEESGEIDMDGFDFGMGVIVELDDNFTREQLSDEEYRSLMGVAKDELHPLWSEFSRSTKGYSKITSIFPTIRNGEHPEIQSSEDLYKVVPKEAIEKIIAGTRERSKIQREAVRAFRLEQISEKEYERQIEASTQAMRGAINNAVTPEQEIYLFGYEF